LALADPPFDAQPVKEARYTLDEAPEGLRGFSFFEATAILFCAAVWNSGSFHCTTAVRPVGGLGGVAAPVKNS
jgi:hypothetical protein